MNQRSRTRERTLSLDELLAVSGLAANASEALEPCRQVLASGGKRLRPRLLFAASELGGRRDDPRLVKAAVAVELFHCASIVHDDVIDDSKTRRDRRTISSEIGNGGAALVGGWLFAAAVRLAFSCGGGVGRRFAETTNRMCEGQMLELTDLFDQRRSLTRYREVVVGKTAALFGLAATLGAELADAPAPVVEGAGEYGRQMGFAYQLLDDILDVAPGASPTGKPPFQDLRHGVYTLPVLYALERDPRLERLLDADLSSGDAMAVATSIRATDGLARAVEDARASVRAARSVVDGLPRTETLDQLLDEAVGQPLEAI